MIASDVVDPARYVELMQWYGGEAALLDDRRFDAWLELLDDEVDYRVPARWNRTPDRPDDFATWNVPADLDDDDAHLPLLHLDRAGLADFVGRLRTGTAWAETPPSRTTRVVGPLVIVASSDTGASGDAEVTVRSALLMHRSRVEWEDATLHATRHDTLRRHRGAWRLRRRLVILDSVVLPAHNLSVPL